MPRIKRLKPHPMAEGRTVSDARPTQEEQDGQPSPRKQLSRHLRPKPPAGVSTQSNTSAEYTPTYIHILYMNICVSGVRGRGGGGAGHVCRMYVSRYLTQWSEVNLSFSGMCCSPSNLWYGPEWVGILAVIIFHEIH